MSHSAAVQTRDTEAPALELNDLAPLDSTSAMPLYMQLAERLATPLRQNQTELVGRALPTEAQCMEHFGISRPTVRQAMAHLVSTGLVTRGRGRGTFVAPARLNHDVSLAFEDEMRAARKTIRFRLLSRTTHPAPAAVQERLGVAPGTPVEHIERLRLLDDEAFAHEQRFLPVEIGRHVTQQMLEEMAIISLLTTAMGRTPARITNTVRCIPAEPRIAKLLAVRPSTPLLQTEHVYYAANGTPLLYGAVRFHGERFQFTLDSPIQAAPGLAC